MELFDLKVVWNAPTILAAAMSAVGYGFFAWLFWGCSKVPPRSDAERRWRAEHGPFQPMPPEMRARVDRAA